METNKNLIEENRKLIEANRKLIEANKRLMETYKNSNYTIDPERLEEDFLILSRLIAQDVEISSDAMLVSVFLLSLPKFKEDGTPWDIHPKYIWQNKNIGRDRVYKAINELCKLGYMEKIQGKNGNLNAGFTYRISSLKKFLPEHDFQVSVDTHFIKKQVINKENNKPISQIQEPELQPIEPQKPTSSVVVVSSHKEKLLEKTKLTASQKMSIKTEFSHLSDEVFTEAIEAFFEYEKKNGSENYIALLKSSLGANAYKKPWTKNKTKIECLQSKELSRRNHEDKIFERMLKARAMKNKYEKNKYFTPENGFPVIFQIGEKFFEYQMHGMLKYDMIIYDNENFEKELEILKNKIEKYIHAERKNGNTEL